MFLRLISDVPKLLLPRVQLSWLLAQPQSLSSSSHATSGAGIWECPKEISPAWTQVVGQDRRAGAQWRNSRWSQSLWELSAMGLKRLKQGFGLNTCLQQGFVREEKKTEPAGEFFLSYLKNSRKTSHYFYKALSANVQWLQEGKEMFKYFSYPGMNCFASLRHN